MQHMDETPIAVVPAVDSWTENFALAGFDPRSGIDIFLHIGRWLKNTAMWRELVTIALPDGSVIAHRGIGNARADVLGPGGANLSVRVLKPYRRLSWSFAGAARRVQSEELLNGILTQGPMENVEFDLEFASPLPVWDLGHVGENTEFMGRGHIEQLGKITGTLKFGPETFHVDTWGNRDHSRGPRIVDDMKRHIWMHGTFGEDLGFLCYDAETFKSGIAYSEACVYDHGQLHKAVFDLGFRLPMTDDLESTRQSVPFAITYGSRTLNIVTDGFPTIIGYHYTSPWEFYIGREVRLQSAHRSLEQGVRFTLDGDKPGYGHMERSLPGLVRC
jgi:hypothetical protein